MPKEELFRGFPHETWEAILNTNHKLEQTNFILLCILIMNLYILWTVAV